MPCTIKKFLSKLLQTKWAKVSLHTHKHAQALLVSMSPKSYQSFLMKAAERCGGLQEFPWNRGQRCQAHPWLLRSPLSALHPLSPLLPFTPAELTLKFSVPLSLSLCLTYFPSYSERMDQVFKQSEVSEKDSKEKSVCGCSCVCTNVCVWVGLSLWCWESREVSSFITATGLWSLFPAK